MGLRPASLSQVTQMATSSLSQFIIRRKIKLLAKYKSRDKNLLSMVVQNDAHLEDRNILGHFNNKTRPIRRDVTKALKDYLASSKPEGDKLAVFVGVSDSGPVCEVFGIPAVSGENEPSMDKHFDEAILNLVVKQPSPAHAILVDDVGVSTFMLYSDSIRSVRTVPFQNNQAVKLFEDELAFLKDRSKSTTILIGLEKSKEFIKEEASEALKGYKQLISHRIIEASRIELNNTLISSYKHWSEYNIVLEMKLLSGLFSEPEDRISLGVDESLEALQFHQLSHLLVHSSVEVYVLIPLDEENGWATRAIDQVVPQQHQRVELFNWIDANQSRFKCQIVIVCSDLPQGEQLQAAGGMAGILK